MRILSWNMKSISSCLQMKGTAHDVIKRVMKNFSLIAVYELGNSAKSRSLLSTFVEDELNDGTGVWHCHLEDEDHKFITALIYDLNTCEVRPVNLRRPQHQLRMPNYFGVIESQGAGYSKEREICAWHAPVNGDEVATAWNVVVNNMY
jgi:hypothetical protein